MHTMDEIHENEAPPIFQHDVIDLTRSFDRLYWPRRLRTDLETLKEAVRATGPNALKVQSFIDLRRGA